ncbi:hypothetical protein FG379_002786 [Cryptosporidium bovis]|uniref:uncharacterized protein n=1 Tax=Cryptosporidium bovis TaxID=310047 RepID=UPI00351A45E7|nr:hypothetical protein FG379_002786 [Cryptosporidium bovis]
METVDSYKEAIELITEYIYKKHGQEDVSIINMILETKGIPKIIKGNQTTPGTSNVNEGASVIPTITNNNNVPLSTTVSVPLPVKINTTGNNLQQNIGGLLQQLPVSVPTSARANGTQLSTGNANGDSSYKIGSASVNNRPNKNNDGPVPLVGGVTEKCSDLTTGNDGGVADNSEDIGERIRDILRSASSVEELNKAIDMAKSAGLTYEANLGERKLRKLLG